MKLVDMIFPKKKLARREDPHELRVTRVTSRATLRRVDQVLSDFEKFESDAREAT